MNSRKEERLLALQPQPHAVEGQHAVHTEVPSDLAQERDVGEPAQPVGIIDHNRRLKKAREGAADALLVHGDRLGREELTPLLFPARIADLAGAAAEQHDRAVAGLLQPPQQHDRDEIAHVERARGQIEADVGRDRPGGGARVERVQIGRLVDVTARLKQIHQFGPHRRGVAGGEALRNWLAVGLMSGTSMDGVDAALVETDGGADIWPRGFHFQPYSEALRARLAAAMADARTVDAPVMTDAVRAVEAELTAAHAEAVEALLAATGARSELVGFHGQTLVHRPERGWTWQIGDGPWLAARLGIDVVYDFRRADMRAGGQGAPLLPVFHRALAGGARRGGEPVAILNLGGVGNLTWLGVGLGDWVSFDTGPANAPIDDWARRWTGAACDEGGTLAAAGRVDPGALAALMAHPYFDLSPPKSLDRNSFGVAAAVEGLSAADGAGNADRVRCAGGRARAGPRARAARAVAGVRGRAPQPYIDGGDRGAHGAGGGPGRDRGLGRRRARSAGVRLFRGPSDNGTRNYFPRDDRVRRAHGGRRARAGERAVDRQPKPFI